MPVAASLDLLVYAKAALCETGGKGGALVSIALCNQVSAFRSRRSCPPVDVMKNNRTPLVFSPLPHLFTSDQSARWI